MMSVTWYIYSIIFHPQLCTTLSGKFNDRCLHIRGNTQTVLTFPHRATRGICDMSFCFVVKHLVVTGTRILLYPVHLIFALVAKHTRYLVPGTFLYGVIWHFMFCLSFVRFSLFLLYRSRCDHADRTSLYLSTHVVYNSSRSSGDACRWVETTVSCWDNHEQGPTPL